MEGNLVEKFNENCSESFLERLGLQESFLDKIIGEQIKKFNKSKEDFIKAEITKKGFGKLLVDIEKRIFPKIAIVASNDGWEYVFVDGTFDEVFIVAIRNKIPELNYTQSEDNAIKIEFEYHHDAPKKIHSENK